MPNAHGTYKGWGQRIKPAEAARIDWSHQLARGLVHAYLFTESGGSVARDLVERANGTYTNGASRGFGPWGPNVLFDGSNDVVSYTALAQTKISAFVRLMSRTSGTSTQPRIFQTPAWRLVLNRDPANAQNGGLVFTTTHATAGGNWNSPASTFGNSEWATVGVSYDGGNVANDPEIYLRGVAQSLVETAAPSGSLPSNAGASFIGNRSDFLRPFDGYFDILLMWDRVLSAAEHAWLDREPYAVFAAPSPKRYFIPVAGQTVSPSGIGSAEALGSATVAAGTAAVSPSGIASAENVSTGTVLTPGQVSVSPSGIGSAEALGTPTVVDAGRIIQLNGIASGESVSTGTVLTPGTATVPLTGIASETVLGTPVLVTSASEQTLWLDAILSGEAVGQPDIQYMSPEPSAGLVSPQPALLYTHTTFGQMKSELSLRLADPGRVFWTAEELGIYVREALEMWQAASHMARERASFSLTPGQTFYNLSTELPEVMSAGLTTADLVERIAYHFLEPDGAARWTGAGHFTKEQIERAITLRRNQFLLETGMTTALYESPQEGVLAPRPGVSTVQLPDGTIDVRRVVWTSAQGTRTPLWRSDEHESARYTASAAGGYGYDPTGTPIAYSVSLARQSMEMRLMPAPSDVGQIEAVLVRTPPLGHPSLGVPDDFAWAVKFGALADLLSGDGPHADPARSEYSERRFREGVELARLASSVLYSEVQGQPVALTSLFDLDSGDPNWQNRKGATEFVAVSSHNLIALAPQPQSRLVSLTLDLVRSAHQPVIDADLVQVGREHTSIILDYAQHLATYKCGGVEFDATLAHHERLMRGAMMHNARLRAASNNFDVFSEKTHKEERQRPRMKGNR